MSRSRRRRGRRFDDHGLDDWLMTYADMITLLLCFFAVFLSVSVPKKDVFAEAREKVMEQFAPMKDDEVIAVQSNEQPQMASGGPSDKLPSFIDKHHSGEGNLSSEGMSGSEGTRRGHPEKAPPIPPGDRIITMEIPSAAVFASGSAILSAEGKDLLKKVMGKSLTPDIVQNYQITIEGHTDDSPIKTAQFPSNWELSTGRAAAVVRFLIEQGIPPQKLRAAGYADVFPKVPNRNVFGNPIPENQSENRRVVIKLERIERMMGPPAPEAKNQ